MKCTLILALLLSSLLFAQPETHIVSGGFGATIVAGAFQRAPAAPVQGAPYSATITNESVQTLADGNRIVQTSTGTTVRDSLGRTRQDAPLPPIGNMSPADAPHLVFLQDPVAQTSYTLNLTEKTAVKNPSPGGMAIPALSTNVAFSSATIGKAAPQTVTIQSHAIQIPDEGQAQTEDLGSKTIEGVNVTGTHTIHTIPAGQIGNDRPLSIVTEVWMSPDLKTVVYSKRSDPRMGDQTFQLTNIVRAEPDPSLFMVPADFKIIDAPGPIFYKTSGVAGQ